MKNQYKILIGFIVLFSFMVFSSNAQENKILLNGNYKVNQNTHLNIDNQFGNIQINTWNRQEFSIKVTLNLSGLSEKEASKIKEKVKVEESITNREITIKTNLNNGSFNINGSGKKFEINYEIFIPDNHPLTIKNSFGNFAMQNYTGPIDLELEYGNLNLGELNDLKLKLAFGNGTIESVNKGNLTIEYADRFTVARVNNIELKSDFSKVSIEKANKINLNSSHGHLTLGSIHQLTGKSDFSGLKINRLESTIQLETSYVSGSLDIAEIANNFQNVNIQSEFSAINLKFESGQKIPFHITTNFGKFKQPKENIELNLRIEDDFDKEYKGTIGQGNLSKGKVFVSTSYGNVALDVN